MRTMAPVPSMTIMACVQQKLVVGTGTEMGDAHIECQDREGLPLQLPGPWTLQMRAPAHRRPEQAPHVARAGRNYMRVIHHDD